MTFAFRKQNRAVTGIALSDEFDKDAPAGVLVYLKSSLTGDEDSDLLNFADVQPTFPHDSTADQFFSESQFESYRRLGFHVASIAFSGAAKDPRVGDSDEELFR